MLDPRVNRAIREQAGEVAMEVDPDRIRSARFQLDMNRASASEWQLLPGIGPTLSARIVEHRAQNGPFHAPEGLEQVKGIGPKTLARVRRWLTINPQPDAP